MRGIEGRDGVKEHKTWCNKGIGIVCLNHLPCSYARRGNALHGSTGKLKGLRGQGWSGCGRPTEGIHLLRAESYEYSSPSSVSKMNLLSSLEKETRGSLSNSAGSSGKFERMALSSGRFGDSSMLWYRKRISFAGNLRWVY